LTKRKITAKVQYAGIYTAACDAYPPTTTFAQHVRTKS